MIHDEPTTLGGDPDWQKRGWTPPPRRENLDRRQEQVDAWRWGLVIVAVLVTAYAAFMWYSIFGSIP